MSTIKLYNVRATALLDYDVVLDGNGDFLATEPNSGDFLKFPGDSDLASLAVAHNEANVGQVPVDGTGNPILSQAQLDSLAAAEVATGAEQAPAEPAQEPSVETVDTVPEPQEATEAPVQ